MPRLAITQRSLFCPCHLRCPLRPIFHFLFFQLCLSALVKCFARRCWRLRWIWLRKNSEWLIFFVVTCEYMVYEYKWGQWYKLYCNLLIDWDWTVFDCLFWIWIHRLIDKLAFPWILLSQITNTISRKYWWLQSHSFTYFRKFAFMYIFTLMN